METEVVNPSGVFFQPTRLLVPLFQRQYVWSLEEQWRPLWEDVVRLADLIERHNGEATHFLGAVVVQDAPSGFGALPGRTVIDGQQRLTTLQLLLGALHNQLAARGFTSLAGRVVKLIENPEDYCEQPEDRFKVWPTNRDREAFTAVMAAPYPVAYNTLPKSRLVEAHRYFSEAIATWLEADGSPETRARVLVPTVTTRLQIASIHLNAAEDAQEIFETLNARGTPLTAADLVKNFVFQRLGAGAEDTERAYDKYWREFETPFWEREVQTGRVRYVRSSLFLGQWLTARTLEDFPAREVFARFKHYVATAASDVGKLLPELRAAADRYRAVVEGSQRRAGELTRLELFAYRIGVLDSEIVRPIVIWLGEPEQAELRDQIRDELLGVLESWFVRRALARVDSTGSNRYMVELLRFLGAQPKDQVAAAARTFLATNQSSVGYWPGDEEVATSLAQIEAYRRLPRGRLRMVLEAVEDHMRGYPDGGRLTLGPVERGIATVEHLMPQHWETHWPADLTPEQTIERNRLVQTIGNLTLVTKALNAKVSNGPWHQKRKHLEQHDDLLLTRKVVLTSSDGWDEEKIVARTRSLTDHILTIWPVPPDHTGRRTAIPRQSTNVPAVDLATLVATDRLPAGTVLRAVAQQHKHCTAVVSRDGRLFIDDRPYPSASAAAVAVTGNSVNGWIFWVIDGTSTTLADVRSDYIESASST